MKLAMKIVWLLVNFIFTVASSFILFLSSCWMVEDDSQNGNFAQDVQWAEIAGQRLLLGFLISTIAFVIVGGINRLIFSKISPGNSKPCWLLAGLPGVFMATSVVVGCLLFYKQRPYM